MPSDLPQAHQELTSTDKIIRWAICPLHEKRSSLFTGPGKEWTFRCTYSDHIFAAKPDRSAPKKFDQVAEWLVAQRQKRVKGLQ